MINTGNKIVLRKDTQGVFQDMLKSLKATLRAVPATATRGRKHPFLKYFNGLIIRSDKTELFLNTLLAFSLDGRSSDSGAIALFNFMGVKKPSRETLKSLLPAIKYWLCFMHKLGAVLLPYDFSRSQATWVNDLEDDLSCYSEVVKIFRDLDNTPWSGLSTSNTYSPAEKSNRLLFSLGTKLALASSWVSAEDLTAEDLLAWRDLQEVVDRDGKMHRTSPVPLGAILELFETAFATRLGFNIERLRLEINTSLRAVPYSVDQFLPRILEENYMPLDVIDELLGAPLRGISSFSANKIDDYKIPQALATIGIDVDSAYACWLESQKLFMIHQKYVSEKAWGTLFGRMNIYILIYLPLWFKHHPDSQLCYSDVPSKFIGPLFYATELPLSPSKPLTLVEFFEYCDFIYSYSVATNIETYFDYLKRMQSFIGDGSPILQPVGSKPPSEKRDKTTKRAMPRNLEQLFCKYLLAKQSLEIIIQDNAEDIWSHIQRVRYGKGRHVHDIELGQYGGHGVIEHGGLLYSVSKFDIRSLLFTVFNKQVYFNPATYVFPFCLIRAGFRGQNIQWLDANTYSRLSDSETRHTREFDWCWVNTDKIQPQAFSAYVRPAVMDMLDIQCKWRQKLIDLGCNGFAKNFDYDNKRGTKWGKIFCLFANDVDTGAPISDQVYSRLWSYTLLDFQRWLVENNLSEDTLVAFMPIKNGNNKFHNSFGWDDWERKDFPPESVKTEVKVYESGAASYCPIRLRSMYTPHAGRATHLTLLRQKADGETVCLTTGQASATTEYYDRGEVEVAKKLSNVLNSLDSGWQLTGPTMPRDTAKSIATAISEAQTSCSVNQLVEGYSLFSLPHPEPSKTGMEGVSIIARERSSNLGIANTHLCALGMQCSPDVVKNLGGKFRCSWCPYAIFSLHLIFEVSAHRHFLAEELSRVMRKLESYKSDNRVSDDEINNLRLQTKVMAEDVLGWYIVEKTLDMLLKNKKSDMTSPSYVAKDKDLFFSQVKLHSVQKGSAEAFVYRLEQVCNNPLTMSEDFRDKVNRAVRYLLMERGNAYAAVTAKSTVSPEIHLAALVREKANFNNVDLDKLITFVNLSDFEWSQVVTEQRSQDSIDEAFAADLLGYE